MNYYFTTNRQKTEPGDALNWITRAYGFLIQTKDEITGPQFAALIAESYDLANPHNSMAHTIALAARGKWQMTPWRAIRYTETTVEGRLLEITTV